MVSKSKILGKPPLILVSIGSTKFPFIRLLSVFSKIDNKKYIVINKFLSTDQFIKTIKKADKIIIHGGPGTFFLAVRYAKNMPLIIPRLAKYKEHVDDHQLFFCKYLMNKLPKHLKKYFVTEEKINKIIYQYLNEQKIDNDLNKFLFKNIGKDELISNLKNYVNSI